MGVSMLAIVIPVITNWGLSFVGPANTEQPGCAELVLSAQPPGQTVHITSACLGLPLEAVLFFLMETFWVNNFLYLIKGSNQSCSKVLAGWRDQVCDSDGCCCLLVFITKCLISLIR